MSGQDKAKKRTRLRKDERRAVIIDAAIAQFAALGYPGVSMDGLAAAAGISKPIVYDHFASKNALYCAALAHVRDLVIARAAEAVGTPGTPRERYQRGIASFFAFAGERPGVTRLLLTPPSGDRDAARQVQAFQQEATARISGLLALFWPGAAGWRLYAGAEFIKSGINAVALWWTEHPEVKLDALVDLLVEMTWTGLERMTTGAPASQRG